MNFLERSIKFFLDFIKFLQIRKFYKVFKRLHEVSRRFYKVIKKFLKVYMNFSNFMNFLKKKFHKVA